MRQANHVLSARSASSRATDADRPTTLLLGDEQPLMRRGLRTLFEGDPGFRVQGEAGDGDTLLELARRFEPDVVLLDAALPGPGILDTVHALSTEPSGGAAVVLLDSEQNLTDGLVLGAVCAGVRGLLCKQGDSDDIVRGVREVACGGFAMSAGGICQLLTALRRPHKPSPPRVRGDVSQLTPRERQIFHLVAQGLTNQQISAALDLSDATVKSHFHRVCHKLSLRNRVDAVILAYELGLAGTRNTLQSTVQRSRTTGIQELSLRLARPVAESARATMPSA